ncbi:carboxypeptidase-like regulatory domain-containing protein [Actinoplanes auranticolor]|uniref:Carboxypeptidase family protein n=1 Tax=Actinoplanes auranticolor TaxID=47988 RepID=A0A919VQS4_9ACTN|nr:carboxypeptidase-like regulatory domain-containing protein [Actinoplanes auranticolor]GIM65847.1 hypothetical protein Aau02nite_20180 [Actinoplanes auranticolor]
MTTRSRAWLVGVAAALALSLTGATLAVSATPAAAAPPAIRILSVSSDSVKSGGSVTVLFEATNNSRRTEKVFVAVSGGLRCTAGCSAAPDLGPGRSRTFDARLLAPKVGPGEETGLNLAVSVRVGTQTAFDHQMIIVRGGNQPAPTVRRVSGRVRDADGRAVTGAALTVRDSAGHDYRTASDGKGRFSVKASDSRPIAAGPITVVARKAGYRTARATVQGTDGGTTVRLTLAAVATPSRTKPSPTAVASTAAAAEEPVTRESLVEAAPVTARTAQNEGSGSLLFTLLGGLLVAAGLGTLALMLIRRRTSRGVADAPTAVLPIVE